MRRSKVGWPVALLSAALVAFVLPAEAVREMGGKGNPCEKKTCSRITITAGPGNPHPRLPSPLPGDWETASPSYGPPSFGSINPLSCKPGANDAEIYCPAWATDQHGNSVKVRFRCFRHVPLPHVPPDGGPCEFHCFVDLAQPRW